MSKKIFTEQEILELSKNKYVKNVTAKGITYTNEFKLQFIAEYENGKTSRKIFEDDFDEVELDDISFEEPDDIDDYDEDVIDSINKDEILIDVLRRELKRAEPDRDSLMFKVIGDYKNEYEGIPIAEIPNKNAFIFKLIPDNKLKKFVLDDIEIL